MTGHIRTYNHLITNRFKNAFRTENGFKKQMPAPKNTPPAKRSANQHTKKESPRKSESENSPSPHSHKRGI